MKVSVVFWNLRMVILSTVLVRIHLVKTTALSSAQILAGILVGIARVKSNPPQKTPEDLLPCQLMKDFIRANGVLHTQRRQFLKSS